MCFELARKVERRLSAELHDDTVALRLVVDFEHIFESEWLEEKFIRSVVVGGDGFRVRIDHDRLIASFAQGKRSVHAAVVELDALADPVGAAAEDHDLLFV